MNKASFKNISFQTPNTQYSGMRRVVRHELPRANANEDAHTLFYDNGRGERLVTVTAFITGRDVQTQAEALEKAMSDGTAGILFLPTFNNNGGAPLTALPEKWQINHSVQKQGMISLTLDFIILPHIPRLPEAPQSKFARALNALDNATNAIDNAFQAAYDVATKPIASINQAVNRINHNVARLQKWGDFLANPLAGDLGALVTDTIALKNAINTLTNTKAGLSISDIGTLLSGYHGSDEATAIVIGEDNQQTQDALDAQFLVSLLINIGRTTAEVTADGASADWQNLRGALTHDFNNIAHHYEKRGYHEAASSLRLAGNETGAAIVEARATDAGYQRVIIKATEPLIRFCYRNYGEKTFAMMADIRTRNNLTHQAIVTQDEELIVPRVGT